MESFNEKSYCTLYRVCISFIEHYCYYSELREIYTHLKGDIEFWVQTLNAHLEMATIQWCMIFGTDSNITHWKHLRLDVNEFRSYLFKNLKIDQDTWNEYVEGVKNFRNNYVAHKGMEPFNEPVPNISLALESTLCLDNWIREKFATDSFTEEEITIYYTNDNPRLSKLYEQIKIKFNSSIQLLLDINSGV